MHILKASWMLPAVLVSACAVTPRVTQAEAMCDFKRHHLEVEMPGHRPRTDAELDAGFASAAATSDAAATGEAKSGSFAEALVEALDNASPTADSGRSESMLFLSGGSQNGAFGAGYLQGWREARRQLGRPGLPSFKVVTGISTGAILSTWAFIDDPARPATRYRASDEREILEPFVRGGAGKLATVKALARRGALGDLIPLRASLRNELTDAVLRKVADGEEFEGRKLYIGAVDVDRGQAVIFDMTEMASRYFRPSHATQRSLIRDCYVEAIIASSAVPMAALPVFIDNRMYIDGGARFGLFSGEIGEAIRQQAAAVRQLGIAAPRYYAIVNGDLSVSEQCGKADPRLCEPPHPPTGGAYGAHSDWSLDRLGLRSVAILINQGYRFSLSRLKAEADRLDIPFEWAKIDPDVAGHLYRLRNHQSETFEPHPVLGTGTMTCPDWEALDREADRPLEFHPRYMHCLVDYGEKRGREDGWAPLE
jgi:hypothetical protein